MCCILLSINALHTSMYPPSIDITTFKVLPADASQPASASAQASLSASPQLAPRSPRSDTWCSAHCRPPAHQGGSFLERAFSSYLRWEFITPALFLEAEKANVRFWVDEHLICIISPLQVTASLVKKTRIILKGNNKRRKRTK